MTLLTDL